ncbi:MAG: hypothetical protein LBQ59_01885 [Candidatus Peribacteria bacterium]|jgi:hypothetical protein|nr:hypothetical protein [Candidatus Peribacteria bacterium]
MPPAGYNLIKTFALQNNIDIQNFTFSNNVKSFLTNLNFFSYKNKIKVDYVVPIYSITAI